MVARLTSAHQKSSTYDSTTGTSTSHDEVIQIGSNVYPLGVDEIDAFRCTKVETLGRIGNDVV